MPETLLAIHKWQPLVGALIGALTSLAVALLVGYLNRRREDVNSAVWLKGELIRVTITIGTFQDTIESKRTRLQSDEDALDLAALIVDAHPRLSEMFITSASRLLPLHAGVAAALQAFYLTYIDVQDAVDRLKRDREFFETREKVRRTRDVIMDDIDVVLEGYKNAQCTGQSALAGITGCILSGWRVYYRARARARSGKLRTQGQGQGQPPRESEPAQQAP
jgi:hypothetical protein